ncbi:MAG TPA: hypothetical protein ENF19_00925 [Candidatus Bathyarchaeota archaeon]|nr:hypothetical protein [Candidatus Bathyarchaeota archaeon]
MPYCTECGGRLKWDYKLRQYSCQSCGLTYTESQLSKELERLYSRDDDEEEKRRQRNQEYLEWWTSNKKDQRR